MPIPLILGMGIVLGIGAVAVLASGGTSSYRVPGFPDWRFEIERPANPPSGQSGALGPDSRRYRVYVGDTLWYESTDISGLHGVGGDDVEQKIIEAVWGGGDKGVASMAYDYYRSRRERHGKPPETVFERKFTTEQLGGAPGAEYEVYVFQWGPRDFEVVVLSHNDSGTDYLARRDVYASSLAWAIAWGEKMAKAFARVRWDRLSTAERLALPPSARPPLD